MKKVLNKNIIFGIIIGGIIFGTAGVTATTYLYNSNQVSYNKNGTNTDVKSALDELYDKASNNSNGSFTLTIPMRGSYNSHSYSGIQNNAVLTMHYDSATNMFTYPTTSGTCWYGGYSYFVDVSFVDTPTITFE